MDYNKIYYQIIDRAKDRVIELATSIADELTEAFELDHPLSPLGFLVNEAEEEEEETGADLDLDDDEPEEIVD